MKKILILCLTSVISFLFLTAFDPPPSVVITIINKSGVKLGIQLIDPTSDDNFYYLTVEKGDRLFPEQKSFEIIPRDVYLMKIYYIETWDPVYGYPVCDGKIASSKLVPRRTTRIVFTECDRLPRDPGEPSMLKFWTYTRFIYPYKYIY